MWGPAVRFFASHAAFACPRPSASCRIRAAAFEMCLDFFPRAYQNCEVNWLVSRGTDWPRAVQRGAVRSRLRTRERVPTLTCLIPYVDVGVAFWAALLPILLHGLLYFG